LALKPDLIIGIKDSTEATYTQLSQIAPTVADEWEGYPSWRDHFNFVAEVLGKTEEAKQVWANYDQRIAALKTALGDRVQDLEISFVHICCGTIDIDLKNSFNGSILADVGLRRPAAQAVPIAGGITSLSEERLMDIDGDVLFVATDGKEATQKLAELKQNPLWKNLRAVQQNRVYPVNYPTWRGGNPLAANAVIDDLFKYLVEES
jgi:iron complex transport system substrate-binding protein